MLKISKGKKKENRKVPIFIPDCIRRKKNISRRRIM
jgi:hypothetical protein